MVDRPAAVARREAVAVPVVDVQADELGEPGEEQVELRLDELGVLHLGRLAERLVGRDGVRLVAHVVLDGLDVVLVDVDAAIELLADLRVEPQVGRVLEHRAREVDRGHEGDERGEQEREREPPLDSAGDSEAGHLGRQSIPGGRGGLLAARDDEEARLLAEDGRMVDDQTRFLGVRGGLLADQGNEGCGEGGVPLFRAGLLAARSEEECGEGSVPAFLKSLLAEQGAPVGAQTRRERGDRTFPVFVVPSRAG